MAYIKELTKRSLLKTTEDKYMNTYCHLHTVALLGLLLDSYIFSD